MPIIKWEPFINPFEEMQNLLSEYPSGRIGGFSPAMDVYQDKNNVYIETPLAGVDTKDVEITIENDILTIRGEMKKESEVDEKNYYRKEIRSGSFYRSVALPAHVVADKAQADSKDGMLKIVIPKSPGAKAKSIAVKIGKG